MPVVVITIDGKPIKLQTDWTVKQMYKEVASKKNADIDTFHLTYGGSEISLNRDGHKLVADYHFAPNEAVVFCERTHGGSRLQPLSGHVTLTKEMCCITFDDDDTEWRAKLACGDVICVEAVQRMLRVTLEDGGYEFHCPKCRVQLQFFVIRHILESIMSSNELLQSLERINDNYLKKRERAIRRCHSCGTNRQRDFTKWFGNVNRVVCNECTRSQGREIEFCWICGQLWRSSGKGCGNSNCDGTTGELRTLLECPTKTISQVSGCPDTRSCPKCGTLIYHIDKCKHIECKCGCNFCFICLKTQDSNGKWQCGGANEACPVAARQTEIPNY